MISIEKHLKFSSRVYRYYQYDFIIHMGRDGIMKNIILIINEGVI
jgi:hypothetical protein